MKDVFISFFHVSFFLFLNSRLKMGLVLEKKVAIFEG